MQTDTLARKKYAVTITHWHRDTMFWWQHGLKKRKSNKTLSSSSALILCPAQPVWLWLTQGVVSPAQPQSRAGGRAEPSGADTSIGTEAPCCCFCCSEKRKITCPSPPCSLSPSLALTEGCSIQNTYWTTFFFFYAETAPGTVSGKEPPCM